MGCHSFRIKLLQIGKLLSHTYIQDWLAGYGFDGKGCTASGVTIHLGQDHAVDSNLLCESLGYIDCVLSGHGINYKDCSIHLNIRLNIVRSCIISSSI